ncbi:MAG TPA: DedA family protein [Solirubrobacterales bacterium]|jgi:membrane protein DedA with SNARE-associated domain
MTWAVANLGALGVLLLMVPESACIPVPSEVTLMAAGFAVHQGSLGLLTAIAAATAGNLIGSLLAYEAGRRGAVDRLGRGVRKRCDAIFARHGEAAVFVARLLPLARTFISLPAGAAEVPLTRFLVLTLAGCAIWSTGFVLVGDLAGAAWHSASGTITRISLAVGGLVLLGAATLRGELRGGSVQQGEDDPLA